MKLYVGNIPTSVSESELREVFEGFGEIESLNLITDRDTGMSRGFGFVEMPDSAAEKAMQDLNGQDLKGRPLTVNQARDRERPSYSGGGNRDRGGDRGGDRGRGGYRGGR